MITNAKSIQTGSYVCVDCGKLIVVAEGLPLPECPGCGHQTEYRLLTVAR